jgi:hypothetical protein
MSNLSDFIGGAPPIWVSGTTYSAGRVVWSPTDYQYFMRKSAGAGTTDPASDTTNWQPTGSRAIKSIQRGVVTVTASNASGSVAITAVNTAKSELRMLGFTTASTFFRDTPRINLGSTYIDITHDGNEATTVSWEVTERY